jgi:hypothetical protein
MLAGYWDRRRGATDFQEWTNDDEENRQRQGKGKPAGFMNCIRQG